MYYGDIRLGDTIDIKFTTRQISGAPFTLAGSPVISAYVGNGTTEITAGITLTVDFDSRTGLNNVRVVASSGNGFATATNVQLVITTGTVNSVSVVGEVIGTFSIEARSALMPTTAARTLDVTATGAAGIDWGNVENPTTTLNLSGTNIDPDQVVASVTGAVGSVAGDVVGDVQGSVLGDVFPAIGSISAATIANNAIDAATFAAGALDAVWSTATRLLTAGTNIVLAKGTGVTGFNDLSEAQVQTQAEEALQTYHLDHLIQSADPGSIVANSSLWAALTSKSATPAYSSYVNTTDSLEAVSDKVTAAGTSLDAAGVRAAVGLASANLDTQLGDIPTVAEFNARTIVAANYALEATSQTLITNVAAVKADTAAILVDTGTSGVVIDSATKLSIADNVLIRDVTNTQDTAGLHSLTTIILATLESSRSGTTWTIRKTGGTTFATKTLTEDAAATPVTGVT